MEGSKFRWDIDWGESAPDKIARWEREGLARLRRDGELDRRYSTTDYIERYQAGERPDLIRAIYGG